MSTYKGNDGVVLVDDVAIGELVSWDYTRDANGLDDTVLGDAVMTKKAGSPTISGNCSVRYDPADASAVACFAGEAVVLKMRPLGTGSGLPEHTVSVLIDSDTASGEYNVIAPYAFSWSATGAMTTANQA